VKIFNNIASAAINKPVASIGIFDGVHKAHQAIIRHLKKEAAIMGGEATIITLWPHPRIVLKKDSDSINLINTLPEKIERLEKEGVENLIILPFDRLLAGTDFETFVREILVESIGIKHLTVGYNHQFGKNREGNYAALKKLSGIHKFSLSQVDPVIENDEKISSSGIRKYIHHGNFRIANAMLGYHFILSGKVTEGNKLGRNLGFPTANIIPGDANKIIPKDGVYAVLVHTGNETYEGMMNIGCRPTVQPDCKESILEVHLLDFEGDLYQQTVRIEFLDRIRDEKKFDSTEKLIAQIQKDKELIRQSILRSKNETL
jgi:riboflavin kinase/FMN adenylyltransferase